MIKIFLLNVMLKHREKKIKNEDEKYVLLLCLRIYLKNEENIIQKVRILLQNLIIYFKENFILFLILNYSKIVDFKMK